MNKNQKIQFNQMIERSIAQAAKNLPGTKGVVSVRLSQDEIDVIDQMVFLELAKNRSDATAMLIREGIRTHQTLFHELQEYTAELEQVKAKMQRRIQESGLVPRLKQADERGEIPIGGEGNEPENNE